MGLSQYSTKRVAGYIALGAAALGAAAPALEVKAEDTERTGLASVVQDPLTTQPVTTREISPRRMYFEIGNRKEHDKLYRQLQNAIENGVPEDVLKASLKESGFEVTRHKSVPNVLVNKDGIAVGVFETDSEGLLVSYSVPTKFYGDPRAPEKWSFELKQRSTLAPGLTRADGDPLDLKAFAILFNGTPVMFTDIDRDGTFHVGYVGRDDDGNGSFETWATAFGPNSAWILRGDGRFGFDGEVLLQPEIPEPKPAPREKVVEPIGDN